MKHPINHDAAAYSTAHACQILGIGKTTLWKLSKTGQIKTIRLLGKVLVTRQEIERVLSEAAATAKAS